MSDELSNFQKQFDEINERLDKIVQLISGVATVNNLNANRLNKIEGALTHLNEKTVVTKPKGTIEIPSTPPVPVLQPILPPKENVVTKPPTIKTDVQNLKDSDPEIVFKKNSPDNEEVVFVDVEEKELNVPTCPVYQKVVNSDGNNIFNAAYEIYGKGDKLLHQGRTNGVGKWQHGLPLGTYKVVVKRKDPILLKMIEATSIFQIKKIEPTELPNLVLPVGKQNK